MPATTFKRKDTVTKAVRRHATTRLDAVINAMTGTGDDRRATAERELRRLSAVLELVRRPLGGEVYRREKRVVARGLKAVSATPEARRIETLRSLAAASPAVNADDLIQEIADHAATPPAKNKQAGPDPQVLRLLADLAEMRMRARYWHLPAGDFGVIAPGLRASYLRVQKLAADPDLNAHGDAAEAWAILADQVQSLERAWPAVLTPTRKELRVAARQARQHATLNELVQPFADHEALRARLDTARSAAEASARLHGARLLAETPAAFVKRLGMYWEAWRGVGG